MKLCLQTVKYLSPCFVVVVQTVALRFGEESVLKEQSSEPGGFCVLSDRHTAAGTKEKPGSQVWVVVVPAKVATWYLQMDNKLKTGFMQ